MPAPLIHTSQSVSKIYWHRVLALSPVVIAAVYLFGGNALRIFAFSLTGALAGEWAAGLLFKKKKLLRDGSAVYAALLFAMMMPSLVPSPIVLICSLLAVLVAKEALGGLGGSPFHPALVGYMFFRISFPGEVNHFGLSRHAADIPSKLDLFLGNYAGTIGETSTLALLTMGGFLLFKRLIHWEIPVIFSGTLLACFWIVGKDPWFYFLASGSFLAAFLFITDPSTTPLTRQGQRIFALGSALLFLLLYFGAKYPEPAPSAVLIMSALAPWLDDGFAPRGDGKAGSSATSRKRYR